MPTYEYRCRDCGHQFEEVQSFSDDALTECPTCGGSLRKIFGNIGVTFKGSGFYKNDHGSRAPSASSSSDGSGSSGGGSSDSSSTTSSGDKSTSGDTSTASTSSDKSSSNASSDKSSSGKPSTTPSTTKSAD